MKVFELMALLAELPAGMDIYDSDGRPLIDVGFHEDEDVYDYIEVTFLKRPDPPLELGGREQIWN